MLVVATGDPVDKVDLGPCSNHSPPSAKPPTKVLEAHLQLWPQRLLERLRTITDWHRVRFMVEMPSKGSFILQTRDGQTSSPEG